jgi:hypothetical protein
MPPFTKGHKFSNGRKKGAKNRITNDVRQVFHKVYDSMGNDIEVLDKATGKKRPQTGHEAMLAWARENQTEFYRLYGKMIPATAELADDMHEDFVAGLIFEEEEAEALIETTAVDVGDEDRLQLPSGEQTQETSPPKPDIPIKTTDSI